MEVLIVSDFYSIAVPTPVFVWNEEAEDKALRRFFFGQVLVPVGLELFHISEEVKVLNLLLLVDFHVSCLYWRTLEVALFSTSLAFV